MKKKRALFILGTILILYAAYNIIRMNLVETDGGAWVSSLINQEGFAPLIVPEEEISIDTSLDNSIANQNIPDQIIIPKINLNAPVEIAQAVTTILDDKEYIQYLIPEEFAAGFHENSAPLGEIGNTVISGHHNAYGEVFADLDKLEIGDVIYLYSKGNLYQYTVATTMILPEKDEPLEVRLENARWILPSNDERITLVTCWPANSNTHRLIIVALPLQSGQITSTQEPCNEIELEQLMDQFLNTYSKARYYSQYAYEYSSGKKDLIIDLFTLKNSVSEFDENHCLETQKSTLEEYMDALMLQAGFKQVGYQGEEYLKVEDLIESYETLLGSYVGTENESDFHEFLMDLQRAGSTDHSDSSENITARNKEEQSLNIREKATSNSRFLGSLPPGSSTVVIGKSLDENWLLIPHKDALGWINAEFVELNTPLSMIPVVLNQIIPQAGS